MTHALLSRAPHRPRPGQSFLGPLQLALARVHEAHGPARHMFAMLVARAMTGPILWISPGWEGGDLHGPGMMRLGVDPGRIIFAAADHHNDLLWTLEEGLRAGVIPLVVGELPGPPALTPMRRLQLAAETGAETGRHRPLGLILTPEGAAAGADSRWHMAPAHDPDRTAWKLARERARDAPPGQWLVQPDRDGFRLGPPT